MEIYERMRHKALLSPVVIQIQDTLIPRAARKIAQVNYKLSFIH